MKYISLLLLSCAILACLPDKTQAHKYHQATFEVVDGRLVESEEDWDIYRIFGRIDYNNHKDINILIKGKYSFSDTAFFKMLYFSMNHTQRDTGFSPTSISVLSKGLTLDNEGYSMIISGSQYANNVLFLPLPPYIDSIERNKNWDIIFPYRIKNKQKCLIIYDLDTVWVKPRVYPPGEWPAEDPVRYPPLDSIYHFP